MSGHASLRRRLVIGVVCFTTAITITTTVIGLWFDEQAEHRVWEAMFRSASVHQVADAQESRRLVEPPFLAFGAKAGTPAPTEFSGLAPGIHDGMRLGDRTYVIDVEAGDKGPVVLALDTTDLARRKSRLDLEMIASALVIVLLLIGVTYLAAQWLVKPLIKLSTVMAKLQPGASGQQIEVRPSDPAEVVVIVNAFNAYLREIDGYVARERKFLKMASHELRTPLAVMSGAAEVAIEQPTIELARTHMARVIDASRSMHDLVELLLALARDPARLQAGVVTVDLARLVPKIVAEHEHLLEGKELAITYGDMSATEMSLPLPIAASVIGNLVRNAIENSSRGAISVSLENGETLVIRDPGTTMSPEERSRLQAKLARAGVGRGDGIGLELVERLCDHAGWMLELQLGATGGTTARLGFRSGEATRAPCMVARM
ncbi:sensor histidine kinase [Dyella solisilvae]|uniref:histidine kinase n=1 Tax=Dyella solisilvae TaxID=1920168 RepID=A0A370K960_9GAMM|nr:HAMP domain-containing sensor histidine kinase [Dyella solisilvae]RDI99169.1 sensor histidine kinase [Dyella solisilvae]